MFIAVGCPATMNIGCPIGGPIIGGPIIDCPIDCAIIDCPIESITGCEGPLYLPLYLSAADGVRADGEADGEAVDSPGLVVGMLDLLGQAFRSLGSISSLGFPSTRLSLSATSSILVEVEVEAEAEEVEVVVEVEVEMVVEMVVVVVVVMVVVVVVVEG